MFGLVGAVGVLVAPAAGRTADRRGPHLLIGASALMMVLSWVILGAWRSVAGLVAGVLLVDIAQQGSMISNQSIIYALRPEARNRINTVYMCGMFLGGSIGAAGAGLAWEWSGWAAVCGFGGALAALGLAVHSAGRTTARRPPRGVE
jgi:predicted MFS family arabinose efflux permease